MKLIEQLSVSAENISVMGHSFGSHVSGFAGKEIRTNLGVKIGRITVTDPARRPFEGSVVPESDRLTSEDAKVVVAIHTDAGSIGYLAPIGTIDFYSNGGYDPQPGCEDIEDTRKY